MFDPDNLVFFYSATNDDDDEEWGWGDDDQSGSVELPTKAKVETEVPRRPGMSLTGAQKAPKTPPHQKKRLTHRTASGGKTPPLFSPPQVPASPYAAPAMSSYAHAPAPASMPLAPSIQKLPSPKAPISKPVVANVKKEDDFFAELGIAARPTFQKPVASSRWQPHTTSLGARAIPLEDGDLEVGGAGSGADWGDDGDLDDLLAD